LELDIYIPDLKLAFEFNGVYWHNEVNKDNNYHLNKTEECEKLGIQLIHIWEDDWLYKQDIVKSLILNKLVKIDNMIYSKDCEIKEIIDNKLLIEFLDTNYIQGYICSKIKIGLFYNNELISLMSFCKSRTIISDENEYDILLHCSKLNTNIIDSELSLFNYFIKIYNPNKINRIVDRSFGHDKVYKDLGFNFINKTEPNYYYVIDGIRQNKFNYTKNKLIKEGYDSNKTEHEIMLDRKIYRIYDSGNLIYKYINKNK